MFSLQTVEWWSNWLIKIFLKELFSYILHVCVCNKKQITFRFFWFFSFHTTLYRVCITVTFIIVINIFIATFWTQENSSTPSPTQTADTKTSGLEFEDLSILETGFDFSTGMPSNCFLSFFRRGRGGGWGWVQLKIIPFFL